MIIKAGGGKLVPPLFFPDATRGVVRNLDSNDLEKVGVKGVVVNTLHLMSRPGEKLIRQQGGVKKFMNWPGLVAADSGGFQIMSLIHKGRLKGKITPQGVRFTLKSAAGKRSLLLTPEKSIQVQFDLGADIMIALDYFTPPKVGLREIKKSVDQTIDWGERAKKEYRRQLEKRQIPTARKPLLLAVIQGGRNKKERERCAQGLLKIGFAGYGFGGWIIDSRGKLDREISRFNAQLTPGNKLRFALGVGKPEDIAACWRMGYHLFDCVLPTRDARHRRLYLAGGGYFYPAKEIYARDRRPVDPDCDCPLCQNHSRAYLHHLFKIKENLALRLATLHNLRTYTRLTKNLRLKR